MNKKKPKKYHVAVLCSEGANENGVPVYQVRWVSEWPKVAIPFESHYETSPSEADAKAFGRDQAFEVARAIRMRSTVWSAMVEEA